MLDSGSPKLYAGNNLREKLNGPVRTENINTKTSGSSEG